MLFQSILFYLFATVLLGAAVGVVLSRNPVHAVMFLVLTFFQSAILWLLAEAEFLAIVLVLVYVGAVLVLFLFVVMMLDVNIEAATAEMRDYSIALNVEYIRIAAELNAKGLILGPGKPNPLFSLPRDVMESHFFRALDTLLPIAECDGIELWVENMPFAFLPEAEGLMASLDRYGADTIGVVYDVANAHFIGEDLVAGLDRVCPRLSLVHLSDTGQSVYRHDPVGLGDVGFAALIPKIKSLNLERTPMLEIISRDPDRDIPQSIETLDAMAV